MGFVDPAWAMALPNLAPIGPAQFGQGLDAGYVWRWAYLHVPKLAAIIAGLVLLLWLVRRVDGRLARLLSKSGTNEDERKRRSQTVEAVFHNTATAVIVVGALLMVLAELGINITPLLGGAAVVGLATAFAAQTLIRDYFYGILILVENQYGIHDEVKLANITGRVERITLRLTVLRGADGVLHFVPNGQITTVSNLSRKTANAATAAGGSATP
jgi:small conductance mechanosensitive channel